MAVFEVCLLLDYIYMRICGLRANFISSFAKLTFPYILCLPGKCPNGLYLCHMYVKFVLNCLMAWPKADH